MRHLIIQENPNNQYKVAIIIKNTAIKQKEIIKHYVDPIGIAKEDIIVFNAKYNDVGKCPVKFIKAHLSNLLPALESLGVKTLFVCDGTYFKTLANERKAEPHYGYVLPCAIKGYEHMNVVLGMNYQALFYNPVSQDKLDLAITALKNKINGIQIELGSNVIHSAAYPVDSLAIGATLEMLLECPNLSCDIETNSLNHTEAGIETISFAWDKHNGAAFCVDRDNTKEDALVIREFLKIFFIHYKGKVCYQNGNYDMKIMIYELWMDHPLDYEGMLTGIDIMTRSIDDTKIITYLATNSTAGNKLDLKSNSHSFMGNYGIL